MSFTIHLPNIFLAIPRNPITAVGLPVVFGIVSGSMTAKTVRGEWYKQLKAPAARPPRQVFPIVWPLLYIAMGYASHVAVKTLDASMIPATRDQLNAAISLYYAQLGFNFLWSTLFFGFKQTGLALIDSTLLAGSTYYMTALLHEPTGAKTTYFLAPYCAWLTFATYLNGSIWWQNRGREDLKKLD